VAGHHQQLALANQLGIGEHVAAVAGGDQGADQAPIVDWFSPVAGHGLGR
jgi:hypothetical protein